MRRVALAFASYVVTMGALAADRWRLWSYGADTGTFTQIALSAFSGFTNTSERGSHFAVHWSPILVTLYPFVALTHSGLAIQIVQIVAIGLGILPLYAFLRRYVEPRFAATLAFLTVLYPPLLAVAFDEFHEIAFYPALVFALVWAMDTGRWCPASLAALLLVLVREEALLVLAVFGIVVAIAAVRAPRSNPRGLLFLEPREPVPTFVLGTTLALASSALFCAYFGAVAPGFGGWTASHFYRYPFADGPRDVVVAAFREPLTVLGAIATPGRATYLLEAFAPLLLLPLRSPWMLVALPGLAVVVLSSEPSAWRMGNHYAGLWAPWLIIATAERIVTIAGARVTPLLARRLAGGSLAACVVVLAVFDPMHPGHYLKAPYADRAGAMLALATTPVDAEVFTHDEWFAHFAGTRPALEHVWSEPEYAVLADDFPHPGTFLPFMRRQVANGCYAAIHHVHDVVVYRRTGVALVRPSCRIPR